MMKRLILDKLISWKNEATRKPVLLDGARQTGKSYLLEVLFGERFEQVIRLDFLEQPNLANIFKGSLNPDDILNNIEVEYNVSVHRDNTLIIFEEKCPQMFVCASGSNIGLLGSFPVGKVELLNLYPMTFEEFLWASAQAPLIKAYEQMNMGKVAHDKLFSLLIDYYFVGGMHCWFSNVDKLGILERTKAITQIQSSLLAGYERDFGKYSDKVSAQHIRKRSINPI